MLASRAALAGAVAALALGGGAAAQAADHPPLDALSQLPGTAGCVAVPAERAEDDPGCAVGHGLADVYRVALSADGASLYAITNTWDEDRLLTFRRGPLGALEQLPGADGCRSSEPVDGCAELDGVDDGAGIAVSPDGRFVHLLASAGDMRITTFARDPGSGALTRLPGPDGCLRSGAATADCRSAPTLNGALALAASPDGRSLYVPFQGSAGGVAAFSVDPASGRVSAAGCVVEGAATAACAGGRALAGAGAAVVSPDGRSLYVAGGGWLAGASSSTAGHVAVFARDPADGSLRQLDGSAGCVRGDSGATAGCATVRGFRTSLYGTPLSLAIAPDGSSLYAGSATEATLTVLRRDAATGALSQPTGDGGCLVDGPAAEGCATTGSMGGLWDLAVSPDGRTLAAASYTGAGRGGELGNSGGTIHFTRAADGTLRRAPAPFACLTDWAPATLCSPARALAGVATVAFAPDSGTLYAGGLDSETIAVLTREAAPSCRDGAAQAVAGRPLTLTLDCSEPNGQPLAHSVGAGTAHGTLRSLDDAAGTVLYTPDAGYVGGDVVTFSASDGVNRSGEARIAIAVAAPPPDPGPGPGDPRPGDPRPGDPTPRDPAPRDPTPRRPASARLQLLSKGAVTVDARGRLRLRLRCASAPGARCDLRVTVRSARRVRLTPRAKPRVATLGSVRARVARGRTAAVAVPLTRAARALLARSRALPVAIAAGDAKPARLTVRARPRR